MEAPQHFRHKAIAVEAWRYESPQDPERIGKWLIELGLAHAVVIGSKQAYFDLADGTSLEVSIGQWVLKYSDVVAAINDTYLREIYEKIDPSEPSSPEPIKEEGGVLVIAQECFSDLDRTVISWQGENFYRGCGVFVKELEDGGQSTCVKPVTHFGNTHEDFKGNTRFEYTTITEGRIQYISLEPEASPEHGVFPIEIKE